MRDVAGTAEAPVTFIEALRGTTRSVRLLSGRQLEFKIPAGVADGQQLRLRAEGHDIVVSVSVAPHPYLVRDGADLRMRLPVTALEAVRGGPIEVPTPTGPVKLKLRPGTQNGQTLRLKGLGIPVSGKPGDAPTRPVDRGARPRPRTTPRPPGRASRPESSRMSISPEQQARLEQARAQQQQTRERIETLAANSFTAWAAEVSKISLSDAQQLAQRFPLTFNAPTHEELDQIEPGSIVKLCHEDKERMWHTVLRVEGDKLDVELDNSPVLVSAKLGDRFSCEKRHVLEIFRKAP